MKGFLQRTYDVGCTIEIEHTHESLHAHVELDDHFKVEPGDQVTVHGSPIETSFGDRVVLQRRATVVRANAFERLMTRALAYLELTELYEVGFSARRSS